MSAETEAVVVDALQAHFADITTGGLMTNWVVVMAGVHADTLDQASHFVWDIPSSQHFYQTLGMVDFLQAKLKARIINNEAKMGPDE